MSSPVDRFRIPGGSLDLDSDDEREGVPAQANLVPSPGPPQIRSQIAHLTPDGLSNVLSRISHPLASRTAEYVRALNLSGNAFRNLDLAALNVLSNHDSAMAEQLLRIQAVLPCSLALESPIQEQDRAFLTANESLSPIGHSPKNVDPSISSSFAESLSMHPTTASPSTSVKIAGSTPPPLSSNTELPSHDTNQHFEDHPSLERRSAAGHSSNELAGDLTSLMQPESRQDDARTAPSSDGHDPRQSSLASQDTSVIGPSAHGGDTTIAPSGADATLSSPSNPQPSASQNETAGQALPPRSSSPSHSSPFVPPEALPSLLPHLATTDIPITGAEIEGSVEPQSPAGNQCDTSSDSGTSNAQTDSSRDTPDADNVMVTLTSGRFSSEPSSEPKASMACHDSSQDGGFVRWSSSRLWRCRAQRHGRPRYLANGHRRS
ncbi:hypothetical protein B0H14DRAFT_1659927 [Mycena olivaceomarginata]|nr:hypothetical protein B0H14DRAFT_1659927 [Mycena olivaceomarginata]